VGVGSTFWFTVKLTRGDASSTSLEVYETAEIAGVRVLAVDDNETNRKVLAGMLESWSCRHAEAPSAEAALRILREAQAEGDPFRIAILDMHMPDFDGEMLGRAIKNDPRLADTALIMMTSGGVRGDASRLEKVGFSAYLVKPVRQSQLYDCLAVVLGQAEHRAAQGQNGGLITRHTLAEQAKRRTRLLLAEDNIVNQKVALKTLEKLGYRADVVGSGLEAVVALQSKRYDLVLMDVQMPEMDGIEATRRIRDPRTGVLNPDTPIVALTAHAMAGDQQRCLEAGMNDYLAKPIRPEEVAAVLSRWIATDVDGHPVMTVEAEQCAVNDSVPPCDEPVFDESILLGVLDGDRQTAAEIAREFLTDASRQVVELRATIESGKLEAVRQQAHTLKGSSATVGARALRARAAHLETLASRAAPPETLESLVAAIENELARLIELAESRGALL
jgi:two-component system sensor histidine kinase/response regulator